MKNFLFLLLLTFIAGNTYSKTKNIHFIQSGNDSIFYETSGRGHNAVLFLSGGPGGSAQSLAPIVDYVSNSNFSILLHQRGTGLSKHNTIDSTTISLDQYINDINKVLEAENKVQVYILGHSWGTILALDYAVKNPKKVKGLILLGAPGYNLDFLSAMNNEIFARLTTNETDSLTTYFDKLNSVSSDAEKQSLFQKIGLITLSKQFFDSSKLNQLTQYGSINQEVNGLMMTNLMHLSWNLESALATLNMPTIIINGAYDPIPQEYAERLNDAIINSHLYFIDNCGHYLWIEKPKELQTLIENFLKINKNQHSGINAVQ